MKKLYFYMMTAVMALTMASCSSWDSPYYVDDIVGSWTSEYYSDGYDEYDLYGYDVVRYDFYQNHTGRYTYYSSIGLAYVDFDWETRGNRLFIRYYDGDYEDLYYGYDNYGYLILSLDRYFFQYTAYSPGGGRWYEPGKTMDKAPAKESADSATKRIQGAKMKSLSRGIKALADAEND